MKINPIIFICLPIFLIAAVIIVLFVAFNKRKRLSEKLKKNMIETDRFDVLTVSQIYVWYDNNRNKIHNNSKGMLASKEILLSRNNSLSFPTALPGYHVFFQSIFTNENKPVKYRFVICKSVDNNLKSMIDENNGYIIFTDLKRGLK